ncbi:uncharacterized protein FTJAE_6432 [Fusarium tjaetaba]|uniref:Uncharacterized protein n=1 Tax=Fusarium tjaetaba TaxID=1567544 RepID=A0A8H5VVT9_9HYPO|nr:uncharacterized protein FTJAE_6432 [Fusarium tjaetaba]KAF5635269.1 hypothetical protein FTJAE_6432 [Fusarium tjaetaba]
MASSRASSGQSAPLLSQDLQLSTAVGFQQQGTVDWTKVLSGSVAFSVDVLSRLSKAGIEAFTIYAARAIFSNVKLGPNGELRLHRALDKISAFPSFGKALWFGFGVKHIIWSMQESAEGLNCLGICACLTEGFSTTVAAKVIRELFLLYDPPAELTPALRQWIALVESSGGLLASSEFGLVLHGLTKLCLMDGQRNLRSSGSPKDIALVLKEVFEVSGGRLDRLFLSGGADCAWIAAVAHWLLDLRVEVQHQDARSTGACLGSAARIFLAAMRDGEGHMEFLSNRDPRASFPPVSESSYGRGFYLLTRHLLPELRQTPVLHHTMEAALNKGYLEAAQQFSQSFTSLRQRNILITSNLPDYDPVDHGLLRSWPPGGVLMVAQTLLAGRQHDVVSGSGYLVAVSHSGLCFFLNTLTEITSDPQRACVVTAVPGRIEWKNFLYDMVRDQGFETASTPEKTGYDAISMSSITNYDNLADTSTPGLNAELLIDEILRENTSLHASYRISTAGFPGRHFSMGASDIWHKLNSAVTSANCEGETCGSLNGFESTLVEGDGLLPLTGLPTLLPPITRVLSTKDLSVWVALSQSYLPPTADPMRAQKLGLGESTKLPKPLTN